MRSDDKGQNDRLIAAAYPPPRALNARARPIRTAPLTDADPLHRVAFCEQHAKKFSGPTAPILDAEGFELLSGQSSYTFKATAAAVDGKRPFAVRIEWVEGVFRPKLLLKFPTVPGLANGVRFHLPAEESAIGEVLRTHARGPSRPWAWA